MATLEQLNAALIKADAAGNAADAKAFADEIRKMRAAPAAPVKQEPEKRGMLAQFGEDTKQTLLAGMDGAAGIGATLSSPIDALTGNTTRRANIAGGLDALGYDRNHFGGKAAKLAVEIGGTMGAGGALANTATKFAPTAAAAAPGLINSLRTGGMVAGNSGAAVNMLTRMAGGAAGGAVGAGLIDPDSAAMGAGLGAAAPVAIQAAGKAAGAVGDMVRYVKRPAETRLASKLAQSLGMTPESLSAALNQQGPQLVPGYQATVPQILQHPVTSQLQRTLKTAGTNALGDAERVQQAAYRDTLENIAPMNISVQDAANRAGGAIQDYAMPARAEAGKQVRNAFEAVDPFNESGLLLPIEGMNAARAKYLGDGTFGTGSRASEAVSTARRVGTQEIPAVAPLAKETARNSQTLEQAVRAAGGMRGGSGELRDLGIKQSKTTGLVNNKSGQSADILAEDMYRRGFIPDADPATLMDALRNGGGRKLFANDQVEGNGMQRMAEQAMGDAPVAETVAKAVPFQTVQNLRSSIGEAAQAAEAKGANKEAAALKQMIAEIDSRINRAAGGSVDAGEYFPRDMADQYRKALKMHAAKMAKFETGPQVGMFRKGGDGQASIQGAEIPGKFYNGRRSQVEDMQALKRLTGNSPDLMDEMKRYATTEAASTFNQADDLTSKYGKWLQSRSGANREMFTGQENLRLNSIGDGVSRGIGAENLGVAVKSNTAQNLESLNNLGLLDSKMINMLATRIPGIGQFTGPMLTKLKDTAAGTRNNALSKLLSNPDDLVAALKPGTAQANKLAELLSTRYPGKIASRAGLAPALLQSDQ